MDLREEYKKSMESASPDREAMDRMKAAVLAKIAAGEGEPGIPEAKKKPLPMRRIACIGGAAAACAVIAVSAATILPNMENATGMVSKSESSASAAAMAGSTDATGDIAEIADAADCAPEMSADSSFSENPGFLAPDTADSMFEDADEDNGMLPDQAGGADSISGSMTDGGAGDFLPPASDDPEEPDRNDAAGDTLPEGTCTAENYPSKGNSVDHWEAVTVEPAYTWEVPTADQSLDEGKHNPEAGFDETAECGETLEMCETMEMNEEVSEPEERMTTIVFSGGDWVSYAGERYTLCKRKPPAGAAVTAVDPVSGTYYHVVQDGGTIAVYSSGKLVGVYKK